MKGKDAAMDKSRRLIDVQVYTQEKLWRIYGANIYSTFSQEISSPSTPSLSFLYQLHVFLRHWLAICRRMYQKHLYHLPQPPKTKPKPKQNKTQQQPSMTEGGGNGNPLWHSCLEDPMDRGAWRAAVLGVAKRRTRLRTLTQTSEHERQILLIVLKVQSLLTHLC